MIKNIIERPLLITDDMVINVGDYFRAYKSKYYVLVKEVGYNQRNYEDGYGEYSITMLKVDIFNKEENLLAVDSIVPIDKIKSGALAKYIPNIFYGPTYLGSADPYMHPVEYKIWTDIRDRCYDCKDKLFPYIGGVGTIMCDRWRCFEYFLADFRHIEGYAEAKDSLVYNHYIVDLYDIQKHIHPFYRVYAPGYVKLKLFKYSDICKYSNLPLSHNNYPKDLVMTTKYITGEIDIKQTLYRRQTGMNVVLNTNTADYFYNPTVGYQFVYPYANNNMKQMCTIL